VRIGAVDETTAKALGMNNSNGVIVQSLEPDGAALEGGVKERDVILSIDGKEVNAANELQTIIARKHPGDQVTLKIFRDGNVIDKKLNLRSRKEEKLTASDRNQDSDEGEREVEPSKSVNIESLGLSLRPLTAAEKKENNVESGVVITDVKRFSEAYNRQLRTGNVILDADKRSLSSPNDFKSVIDKHKPGDALLLRVKTDNGTAFVAIQIPKE
jgi:serine protease Do